MFLFSFLPVSLSSYADWWPLSSEKWNHRKEECVCHVRGETEREREEGAGGYAEYSSNFSFIRHVSYDEQRRGGGDYAIIKLPVTGTSLTSFIVLFLCAASIHSIHCQMNKYLSSRVVFTKGLVYYIGYLYALCKLLECPPLPPSPNVQRWALIYRSSTFAP